MEELINEAKNGDEEAFTKIIIVLEKDLYRIARMRFSSEDDICEVVQQTIIASFYNIKKLKNVEYFKTWIIKILLNKCNKFYTSKIKNGFLVEYNDDNLKNISKKNEFDKINSELDFDALIKDFNYKERITLILYYVENLTTKEIGKILKESDSTVRNRLARSKIKLKNKLEERGECYG